MSRPARFGSALSIIALASLASACAAPSSHIASASRVGSKPAGQVGLATRAIAELNANNVPAAIDFAEKAVTATPSDAGFRALLGSAYFAGGRFKSAEQAYKDSLYINSNQPQVVLKLALVEIGLGKNAQALSFLDAGRDVLDPADYGLAIALAGRPTEAIDVLQAAARGPEADARVRQNLALAYALAGDWTNARTVAAQDVPGDQLDARIHDWMQMARPGAGSTAVAMLVGVTPAPVDPGQPTQLALVKNSDTQLASAALAPVQSPAPAPVAPAPQEQVAQAAPPPAPAAAPPPPVAFAEVAPPPEFVSPKPRSQAPFHKPAKVASGAAPTKLASARPSGPKRGSSRAVVQLGSYSNPKSVLMAWNAAARRYHSLQGYVPVSARFASQRGTFFRLSIQGFGSVNEAAALCSTLRHSGGACFVRNVAGDAPMQIASNS